MTYGEMARSFAELKSIGVEMGPELIAERGIEKLFVRLAMVLEAYADGWIDAGGSVGKLEARSMDESYAVELNRLRRQIEGTI